MSTYLVLKRLRAGDGEHFANEVLTDPDNAAILMERGFISPVPDNFSPPKGNEKLSRIGRVPTTTPPAFGPWPTVEQALAAGYTQEAAERMARGEFGSEEEAETKALEEAVDSTRPQIYELAEATEETVEALLGLPQEDYDDLVAAFLAKGEGEQTEGSAEGGESSTESTESTEESTESTETA